MSDVGPPAPDETSDLTSLDQRLAELGDGVPADGTAEWAQPVRRPDQVREVAPTTDPDPAQPVEIARQLAELHDAVNRLGERLDHRLAPGSDEGEIGRLRSEVRGGGTDGTAPAEPSIDPLSTVLTAPELGFEGMVGRLDGLSEAVRELQHEVRRSLSELRVRGEQQQARAGAANGELIEAISTTLMRQVAAATEAGRRFRRARSRRPGGGETEG